LKEFSYPNAGPVPLIGVFLMEQERKPVQGACLGNIFEFTFSFFMTPKVFRFYRIAYQQSRITTEHSST